MGTNYYAHLDCCKHCGRSASELHIGKSSHGWPFSVHIMPERGIESWADWVAFIKKSSAKIVDEYGHEVTLEYLDNWVKEKRKYANDAHVLKGYADYPNHAKPDPETGDKLTNGEFC